MYHHDLTDLINSDPAAYDYYFSLAPKTQELLQRRDIRSLHQLRQEVEDIRTHQRPAVF